MGISDLELSILVIVDQILLAYTLTRNKLARRPSVIERDVWDDIPACEKYGALRTSTGGELR
jgi:hypothetical protein